MNIKKVNLGGEQRPIKFGFNALTEFGELTNRSLEALNTLNPGSMTMKDMLLLCWCALKQGARKEGIPFDFEVEDVGDWLDDNPEAMVTITAEYQRARSTDQEHPNVKKNPGKSQSR